MKASQLVLPIVGLVAGALILFAYQSASGRLSRKGRPISERDRKRIRSSASRSSKVPTLEVAWLSTTAGGRSSPARQGSGRVRPSSFRRRRPRMAG